MQLSFTDAESQRIAKLTWQAMMQGDTRAWWLFFRMIEDGCSQRMIAENSETYDRRTASRG
jgi:hypothetical protein